MSTENILTEYQQLTSDLEVYCEKLTKLIEELTSSHAGKIHYITSRVKQEDSLREKLLREDKYAELRDLTDVVGIRIVTYFKDDIDRAAAQLVSELEVDQENSVDKGRTLDPDRFGYSSLHYVFELSPERRNLPEWRSVPDLKFEVQLRTILQHAWAEIEHDLGYKSEISVPKLVRRRFSRLAGLLEIADDEFIALRKKLREIERDVANFMIKAGDDIELSKPVLKHLLQNNNLIGNLDRTLASIANAERIAPKRDFLIEHDLEKLDGVNIRTERELLEALEEREQTVVAFANEWLDDREEIAEGLSILYLCYILLSEDGDVTATKRFLETTSIGPPTDRERLAEQIHTSYRLIRE